MAARIILLECSAPHWIPVVKQLALKDMHVVYWTGWNRLAAAVKENFPSCIYHDTLFAKRALDPAGKSSSAGFFDEICESVWREDAQVVYDMMNRFDHSRDLTHVERSLLFYQCLVYWSSVIKNISPDLVIFSAPPHVVYDYIFLCILRRTGVQTLMFEEIPCMPPHSLYTNDYRDGLRDFSTRHGIISDDVKAAIARMRGEYENGIPQREALARAEMKIQLEGGMDVFLENRKTVADIDAKNKGKYVENERLVNISSLYKERGRSLRQSFEGDFSNTRYMDQMVVERKMTIELCDYYHAHVTSAESLNNYIYFPLAGQPERTSNPQADIFSCQILVANLIAHSMPSDLSVVVKEHPNQFHPNFAVNMCRSIEYYQEMLQIQRLKFVASLHNSFDLIDRSLAVATTGGTAGIEAVARGKPVLLFGDAWYRDCPGVHRVKNSTDVARVLEKIVSGTTEFRNEDLADYMESLIESGFRGIADYPPEGFPLSPQENVDNLVEVIARVLQH